MVKGWENPIDFSIFHKKLEDGRIELSFFSRGKIFYSIGFFFTEKIQQKLLKTIKAYLVVYDVPKLRKETLQYGNDLCFLEFVGTDYDERFVEKPVMTFEVIYKSQKGKFKKEIIRGYRQQILQVLYNCLLEINSENKDEEIESLLETNLFNYFKITEGVKSIFEEELPEQGMSEFELEVIDVKELDKNTKIICGDDGAGSKIYFVDKDCKRSPNRYKTGKMIKPILVCRVRSVENLHLPSGSPYWSEYKKNKNFEDFPFYSFKSVISHIVSDGVFDYSFEMNMIKPKNDFIWQSRLIQAVIEKPIKKELENMSLSKGICYFEAVSEPVKEYFEYDTIYPETDFGVNQNYYSLFRPCTQSQMEKVESTIKELREDKWDCVIIDFKYKKNGIQYVQATKHNEHKLVDVEIGTDDDKKEYKENFLLFRKLLPENEAIVLLKELLMSDNEFDLSSFEDMTQEVNTRK